MKKLATLWFALSAVDVQAACYAVYDGSNELVYRSTQSPIDLSGSIERQTKAIWPTGSLIIGPSHPRCTDVDNRVASTPTTAGTGAVAYMDSSTQKALEEEKANKAKKSVLTTNDPSKLSPSKLTALKEEAKTAAIAVPSADNPEQTNPRSASTVRAGALAGALAAAAARPQATPPTASPASQREHTASLSKMSESSVVKTSPDPVLTKVEEQAHKTTFRKRGRRG